MFIKKMTALKHYKIFFILCFIVPKSLFSANHNDKSCSSRLIKIKASSVIKENASHTETLFSPGQLSDLRLAIQRLGRALYHKKILRGIIIEWNANSKQLGRSQTMSAVKFEVDYQEDRFISIAYKFKRYPSAPWLRCFIKLALVPIPALYVSVSTNKLTKKHFIAVADLTSNSYQISLRFHESHPNHLREIIVTTAGGNTFIDHTRTSVLIFPVTD
ncbi:MAG: hypothetical protein JWQ35_2586 [Bacteriovoracaceae bacterium]|nr:hypothetical protein [Bacteriovoracaceae bacterium]